MLIYAQGAQLAQSQKAREKAREGSRLATSGMAHGIVQANLLTVPRQWAYDVLLYAQRNPKACPILEVIEDSGVESQLAPGSDLRKDIPRYRIWNDGKIIEEPNDVTRYWREDLDLVSFLIGCSFTFEAGLADAHIEIRHQTMGRNVPMYKTAIPCEQGGRLSGVLVVSMRPIKAERIADAVQISGRYPAVHGAPVHVGPPAELGIADLYMPDYGEAPVRLRAGEVPVFWACGVTPQAAITQARVPYAITHAPGCMFVTDVLNESYCL